MYNQRKANVKERENKTYATDIFCADGQGHLITTGNNVIINSVNGVTMIKIAKSGYTPNGVPYRNVTTDLNNGDYLYHDETFYNSTSNAMERIRWRQNLRNPGAQLEYLPNE